MNSFPQVLVETRSLRSKAIAITPPIARKSGPPKLPAIQILRAFAAALVVFHHFSGVIAGHNRHHSWILASRLPQVGAAGVDIFFVISGFIMFYTTTQRSGGSDARAFLFKRTLRIYPLYWFWSTVLFLIVWSKPFRGLRTPALSVLLGSYLLFPVFNGHDFHPFLDQGWTLSFEMLFYGVFSLAIWLSLRRAILPFLTGCSIALLLLSALLPSTSGMKYLLSNTLIIEFLFGVFIAKLLLRRKGQAEQRPIPLWVPVTLTAFGAVLLASTSFVHTADRTFFVSGPWRFMFWGVPSALVVSGFATWNQKLTHPLLVYLGDASYTTYLGHTLLLGAFRVALERFGVLRALPVDLEIILAVTATIALTVPAYQWIERPLMSSLSVGPGSRRAPAGWLPQASQAE